MVILGWGGVGWGNNVHVNLHTHVMLRYGYLGVGWGGAITFMSTCTHTSCYVMVILGWGRVGWGTNVHVELAAGQQSLGSSALETLKKKIWQQVAGGSWRPKKKANNQHVWFQANIRRKDNSEKKKKMVKSALSCETTRTSETLKKWHWKNIKEVEATKSKKWLTVNLCMFMLTLKFIANTNEKWHLFILTCAAQQKMTLANKN